MASHSSWPQQDQTANMMGGGEEGGSGYGVKAGMADSNMVRFGFRIAALFLGTMMIIASFVELWNLSSFTRFFIAIYNMLFAALLILHESQGLLMCNGVDSTMRRYFGLLYGHMGRAVFIIFIAFLNFALTDAGWLGNFTALLLLLLGGVMMAVFLKYPHLLDESPGLGDLKTAPPRQGEYAPPPTMPSTNL